MDMKQLLEKMKKIENNNIEDIETREKTMD